MWWKKKVNVKDMQFSTRAEAFAYMLKWQLEERKADPMEAAEKANQFADIFSANVGVPAKAEPEPKGIEKYMQMADKVVCYCEEHPRIVEYIAGAATFFAGLVVGNKGQQAPPPPSQIQQEPIDFENVK
jgi:hypothetical protein